MLLENTMLIFFDNLKKACSGKLTFKNKRFANVLVVTVRWPIFLKQAHTTSAYNVIRTVFPDNL